MRAVFVWSGLATWAAGIFSYLAEFEELFVGGLFHKLFKASKALHVTALNAGVVPNATDAWDDPGSLHSLSKTTDYVRTALVIVFVYLYVGCHKCNEHIIKCPSVQPTPS